MTEWYNLIILQYTEFVVEYSLESGDKNAKSFQLLKMYAK